MSTAKIDEMVPPIHWIVEADRFDEGYLPDIQLALDRMSIPYTVVSHIPFTPGKVIVSGTEQSLHQVAVGSHRIIYGSINLLRAAEKYTSIDSGVTWVLYKCSVYYPYFQSYLFNSQGSWFPLQWVINATEKLFSFRAFVRPNEAVKTFKGDCYSKETLLEATENVDKNILVYLAEPTPLGEPIEKEYRVFCNGSKIITGSQYRENEKKKVVTDVPGPVMDFITDMLQDVDYFPDDIFAVDIAEYNGRFYLLELSPWACAGFYGCDIQKLITKITQVKVGK